jgi:isopentenyl diphosphate isomerase/L-lactate dehydrogenase-like FMN-dependent dehydrogenase
MAIMSADFENPKRSQLLTAAEYRTEGKRKMLELAAGEAGFDFIDGGAGDETTCQRNRAALDAIRLTGRVLGARSHATTSCSFAGLDLSAPIAIAPMAYHALVAEDAELATAKSAAATRIPFIVSTMSTTPFSALAKTHASLWFQLYMMQDAQFTKALVDDAVKHGCRAIVLTVDVPVFGHRLRDARHGFRIPEHIARASKVRAEARQRYPSETAELPEPEFVDRMFKLDLDWEDVREFCKSVEIPVILKGILHPEDAKTAEAIGVDGIIVSNHGGRQFDAHPATIEVLPKIRAAVKSTFFVGVDGGFQSGTDVLRGLALGANLVLLGRTVMYALAAGGEPALKGYLDSVLDDLRRGMALCGVEWPEKARDMKLF